MPTTRSAARKSSDGNPTSTKTSAGNKRKADSPAASSPAKTKAKAPKKQKTLEETLPDDETKKDESSQDTEMKDADSAEDNTEVKEANDEKIQPAKDKPITAVEDKSDLKNETKKPEANGSANGDSKAKEQKPDANGDGSTDKIETNATRDDGSAAGATQTETHEESGANATKQTTLTDAKAAEPSQPETNAAEPAKSTSEAKTSTETAQSEQSKTNESTNTTSASASGEAVEQSSQRERSTPSSILEKGIIYFFFRGRVGIDDPSNVDDLARSYIVLRPLPRGAKLTDGTLGDQKNLRLLAVPKKVLPTTPNDRFMIFVEKAGSNLEELKKEFLAASEYETKTAGTRHTPAATPVAEGVYAITSVGRESHLAYILTIPKELSEVQKDIGLEEKGSWVTSVKNPQHKGPAVAQLPKDPEFPKEILDEFRTLRWGPLQPKHLDYENCQLLLIGHKDHAFAKATTTDDKEADPKEEIEKLGEEEERRVEHLDGNDTVFDDLDVDAKEYSSVPTTW